MQIYQQNHLIQTDDDYKQSKSKDLVVTVGRCWQKDFDIIESELFAKKAEKLVERRKKKGEREKKKGGRKTEIEERSCSF